MAYYSIEIEDYPLQIALYVIVANLFQQMILNFWGGKFRSSHFSKDFMVEHFGAEHYAMDENGKVPSGGYPDCGNGLHSLKLDYKQWFEFNIAQRIAKHSLETICMVTMSLSVLAIVHPMASVYFGLANFVFRFGFVMSYSRAPQMRMYFAPLMMFNMVAASVYASYSCVEWVNALPAVSI